MSEKDEGAGKQDEAGGGGKGDWESKLREARKEAADERKARQELESKLADAEAGRAKLESKYEKLNERLGGYELRDKRAEALTAAKAAFEKDEANAGKVVDWDKLGQYLGKVNRAADSLGADLADGVLMFTAEKPKAPDTTVLKGDMKRGDDNGTGPQGLDQMFLKMVGKTSA